MVKPRNQSFALSSIPKGTVCWSLQEEASGRGQTVIIRATKESEESLCSKLWNCVHNVL